MLDKIPNSEEMTALVGQSYMIKYGIPNCVP